MSLQDQTGVEGSSASPSSPAFCGSGGSSFPSQEGPDPHFFFRNHAAFRDCRKVLVSGRTTLWLHRTQSHYLLADHAERKAYLVIGSRAAQLEADLGRLGYTPDRIAAGKAVRHRHSARMEACLRRYFWMDPAEEAVMLSFKTRRG